MKLNFIVNSIFNSITYILPTGNEKECWLVDCGDVEKVIEQGWRVQGVLLTHAHFDHIYGLNILCDAFPSVRIVTNKSGQEGLQDPKMNFSHYHDEPDFVLSRPENVETVSEGDMIKLSDDLELSVIETPGHEPSCICYYNDDLVFTGDSYIPGVKVVTSFPRSDKALAKSSEQRIIDMASSRTIFPGHKLVR